ncbi:Ail/Lom family outer membrane beta-barrel protein, partial [Escherichia coli]
MRKVCAAILSAAICLAVSGAPAWASSFSYAGDKNRQLTRYSDTRW